MNEPKQRIEEQVDLNIEFYSLQPEPEARTRLRELGKEWSIERTLETNASFLALTGALLGLTLDKKWFLLSAGVMGFLFQHSVQGWCPPLPVFRRLGFRTRGEIDREKYGIKAARGEFQHIDANK